MRRKDRDNMDKTRFPHDAQTISEVRAAKKKRQKQLWAQTHREQNRAYGRAFYQRNREKRKACSIEYYHAHSEQRSQYSKAYYRRKKAEDPNYVKNMNERAAEYRRKYYGRDKDLRRRPDDSDRNVKDCQRTLSQYSYKSIETIQAQFPEIVAQYLARYPFEPYGDSAIRRTLHRRSISPAREEYDDCYEAGMLAYLYSIHRCAAMGCDYTVPYICKIVRIYIVCALAVYHDARNLCRQNGFREIRLDTDAPGRRY